jgi:hypothetical protein
MTNNSDHHEFGKRKPVSVPESPRSGPPAKRSGHVALLLMGTVAVGTAAYTLMPNRNCEPSPNAASSSLQQGSTECSPRSSSSSSGSGGSGGGSSRSSYYSSDSSSSHSSSGTSDSGSHSAQRGGFGSFGHSFGFSGG